MSIASELSALNGYILGAYDEINDKGGTVPANKNMANLASAIASISGGGGGEGIPREVDANGVYGIPTQISTFSLPANATDIGAYALYYAFYGCTSLTSVNLSSLATVSGSSAFGEAFRGCTSLTSVNLSSLTTVSGNSALSSVFMECTSLTSVNLSSLTTVSGNSTFGNTFNGCTSLTSVNFSSLTTISSSLALSSAFINCTSLTSLSFPALTASSFGRRTNQFNSMLNGCSNVTVHFPAAIQSTIGSWSSVTSGFGGTNTTVLFDL